MISSYSNQVCGFLPSLYSTHIARVDATEHRRSIGFLSLDTVNMEHPPLSVYLHKLYKDTVSTHPHIPTLALWVRSPSTSKALVIQQVP